MSSGPSSDGIDMSLSGSRLGKQVFEFKEADKSYPGQVILNKFNYLIKPGDRIGIVGRNGSGKSTFLNILAGQDQFDSGELISGTDC